MIYVLLQKGGLSENFLIAGVLLEGAAAYQLGNTSSRTITEIKQR